MEIERPLLLSRPATTRTLTAHIERQHRLCTHCCCVCLDVYAQAALKKKTEQAARWKKLYDEAQEEANRKKEEWAAAEVKAYRLVCLPAYACCSSMLTLAALTRAC
jgi:hypothetical protein